MGDLSLPTRFTAIVTSVRNGQATLRLRGGRHIQLHTTKLKAGQAVCLIVNLLNNKVVEVLSRELAEEIAAQIKDPTLCIAFCPPEEEDEQRDFPDPGQNRLVFLSVNDLAGDFRHVLALNTDQSGQKR